MNIRVREENIELYVGTKRYGGIAEYSVIKEPDPESEEVPPPKRYVITFCRKLKEHNFEGNDPFNQTSVTFKIVRKGKTVTFSNCEVVNVEEFAKSDQEVYIKMKLISYNRSV